MSDNNRKGKVKIDEKPNLAWVLEDYLLFEEEPPRRVLANPKKTEGEMMNDEEIQIWFLDSIKALKIIKEENEKVFKKLYKEFTLDLEYLYSLRKIDEGVLEFVYSENNFEF